MANNITRADLDAVIELLRQNDPILTHAKNVREFEREWSEWLGVKHSVMLNSGASANFITLTALRETRGCGEIIVPPLTWVSDIAAVLHCGHTPVFVDINPRTLGMDDEQVVRKLTKRTKAVFITHVLGYNALTQRLLDELAARNIPLIEDCCESYGATFAGRKLGTFGWVANFSFYYAHHLSTIEGGMVSTDDAELHEVVRMLRSHGLVREASAEPVRRRWTEKHPDLNPDFIFAYPGYNMRPTEINGLIGRSQLRCLDANNARRTQNLKLFLAGLDSTKYRTDFMVEGSCNYAFTLVLRRPDAALWTKVEHTLRTHGVEFRRGTAGGGNQLRQPYLRRILPDENYAQYPQVEHVHRFGCYIGNYPTLHQEKIGRLCGLLNAL